MLRRSLKLMLVVTCPIAFMGQAQPGPSLGAGPPLPGDNLFAQGRFAEATPVYEQAAAAAPESGPALARVARMRLYQGRENEAIELARKALELAPGNPIASATLNVATARQRNFGADLYQIEAAGGTSVPFVITDPLPVVRVNIGGRQAEFLIDTGAPDIMLRKSFADSLGLPLTDGGVGTFAGGRQAQVQRTVVPELELGRVRIRNVPAGVNAAEFQFPGVTIDGIIGTGLLMQFLSTIDYCDGELTLAPRSESSAFQTRVAAAGANVVPFWFVGDHYMFATGKLNEAEGLFFIDTGLAGGGVTAPKATLDAAGITVDESNPMTGQGGGGAVQFVPFRAAVTLGSLTRSDVPGIYILGGNALAGFPFTSSGIISHSFFRQSRLTFDFEAMRLVTEGC